MDKNDKKMDVLFNEYSIYAKIEGLIGHGYGSGEEFLDYLESHGVDSRKAEDIVDVFRNIILRGGDKMNEELFSGEPKVFRGLSNEEKLIKICPKEFLNIRNEWSEYCSKLFFLGADTSNWKWKTDNKTDQLNQIGCFKALLRSWNIKHEHKEAVAGWMLSEMLVEVPEHLAVKKEVF